MEIVYRKLSAIKPNHKNPRKAADKDSIRNLAESIKNNPRFFEARPILLSDRTGELVIVGGERRSEAAALLGMDEVPTILLSGLTEAEEDEILIKDNTHAGVWDSAKLAVWDRSQLRDWGVTEGWAKDSTTEDKYTRKIETPVYEPKGEMPDVSELYDNKKCQELCERIMAAKIPTDVRVFLLAAAQRHVVFNYEKIAEYYAHASKKVQRLFEESALVIIDFDDAIGGGYVKLCESLIEQYAIEQEND